MSVEDGTREVGTDESDDPDLEATLAGDEDVALDASSELDATVTDVSDTLTAERESVGATRPDHGLLGEPVEGFSHVGRYVVLGQLGAGAMGVVFSAYDPELDRKVAVKLLHSGLATETRGRAKLLHEAQAMAAVSHRNLVTVYDVGEHDERVFIAMEYIEGLTFRRWLRAGERSWREVLAVLRGAGAGLAAVHRASLVHRDFKPDNIMVTSDGRAVVLDFGLARSSLTDGVDVDASTIPAEAIAMNDATHGSIITGTIAGTPAYMAPEQFRGRPADARTDLFAFCVTLYESLYRQRPFSAASVVALAVQVLEGRLEPPPKSSNVPEWLRGPILRGLSGDPDARWPSMQSLLEVLDDDPRQARRRLLLRSGVVAGAGIAIFAVVQLEPTSGACEGGTERLVGVWDPGARESVRRAMLRTELPYAEDTWQNVRSALDQRAGQWVAMHRQACESFRAGNETGAALDRRMTCLKRELDETQALVEVFREADGKIVEHAVRAVSQLHALERCADADHGHSHYPIVDGETRAEIRRLEAKVVHAKALELAGKFDEGLASIEPVRRRADTLDYAPLQIDAAGVLGTIYSRLSDHDAAEAELSRAFWLATGLERDEEAARLAVLLVYVVGYGASRHDDGWLWSRHARAAIERSGANDLQLIGRLLGLEGLMLDQEREDDRARERFERALEIRVEAHGQESPEVAISLDHLGNFLGGRGEHHAARACHERALAIHERTVGTDHPDVAKTLINLSNEQLADGQEALARAGLERAVSILDRTVGLVHPDVAMALNNLGNFAFRTGDPRRALAYHERSLAILERTLPENHRRVATGLANVGAIALVSGDFDRSQTLLEQSLLTRERRGERDSPTTATTLTNLAVLHMHREQHDRALDYGLRALEVRERAFGPENLEIVESLRSLGQLYESQNKMAEAKQHFERGIGLIDHTPGRGMPLAYVLRAQLGRVETTVGDHRNAVATLEEALELPKAQWPERRLWFLSTFSLARSLWAAKIDRARALLLAENAYRDLLETPNAFPSDRDNIESWLAKRRRATRTPSRPPSRSDSR